MPHLGPWEIVAIVAVVFIIFGVGRMPQALGALGKGVRSFRKAAAGEEVDTESLEPESGKEETGSKEDSDSQERS